MLTSTPPSSSFSVAMQTQKFGTNEYTNRNAISGPNAYKVNPIPLVCLPLMD
jgi:hypothetical protein